MVLLLGGCGGGDTSSVERYVNEGGSPDAIALVDGVPWVLDTEANQVFAVDPADRSVTARVLVEPFQRWLQPIDGALWVLGYRIQRIDPSTGELSATGEHGYRSAASVQGRFFATRDGGLYELDPASGGELAEVELPPDGSGTFGREVLPAPLVVHGDTLWVAVTDGGDRVYAAFDPAAGTFGATVFLPVLPESALVLGDVVWSVGRGRELMAIDAVSGEKVDGVAPLPDGPAVLDEGDQALAVGTDGSLWALDQPAQILYRLDPLTGAVLGQLKLRYRPDSMVITDDTVWIANYSDGRLTTVPRSAVVAGE